MKRIFWVLLITLLLVGVVTTAGAVTQGCNPCDDEAVYRETSVETFLVDNSGRLTGTIEPCEDLKLVGFQSTTKKAPVNIEDGMAVRRRVKVRVELDDELYVIKGGKDLEVTITIDEVELVESILGEGFTNKDIVDATIYCPETPCGKNYAAHIFLKQKVREAKVGYITFANCKRLNIYAGDFFGTGCLVLGFRAKPLSPEPECTVPPCQQPTCQPPCQQPPCQQPCQPACPDVTVTTTTTTVVTSTTTVNVDINSGSCNTGHKPGCKGNHSGGCH